MNLTRQQQAQKIIEAPHEFAVCCGCGSIVTRRSSVCISCFAFRFNLDEESIVFKARELATREASSVAPGDLQ